MFTYFLFDDNGLLIGEFNGFSIPKNATLNRPSSEALPSISVNDDGETIVTPPTHFAVWKDGDWLLFDAMPDFKLINPEKWLTDQKALRKTEVANITVTTAAGNTFDGNEDAQNRMSRAVIAMSDTDTITWVLADNTVATVSRDELREALRLAGEAMSSIWLRPYV